MPSHGRSALALIALSLATAVFAADAPPPELAALKSKAENGNAIAQYNLGLAYASGNGVPLDQAEAYVWLSLATEQGSTGKDLGLLVAGMSTDMLERANAGWRPHAP
jgi:TPR repeat protein